MHYIEKLPAWEKLFKRIVWEQIGELSGKKILDFGSGQGVTSYYFSKNNEVVAIEPYEEMLKDTWNDNNYKQIIGDISSLNQFEDEYFDVVICHNVLEYIDDKKTVVTELARVLKKNGTLSIAKHNRYGRVFQMAVLLNDLEKANEVLDGKNGTAAKFGEIKYYDAADLISWNKYLSIISTYGIRTFFDLQQNQEHHCSEDWQNNMMKLEMRVSQIDEFINVAFFHHILLIKY